MSGTLAERIVDQYASPSGSSFYRNVMGDGSDHMHYGLYSDDKTQMRTALTASCQRLLEMAMTYKNNESMKEILDLGAGAGGPAKCLLSWTDARVTCVDLCDRPLQALERWACSVGMPSRLKTFNGSFHGLPAPWTQCFDLVWSQDAFCHAANRLEVFKETMRVLRPSGVLVFSDILLGEDAPEEHAEAFKSVNVVTQLGTHQEYMHDLKVSGFTNIRSEDWTSNLPINFQRMLAQIKRLRSNMLEEGVSEEMMDRFSAALEQRLQWANGSVLKWRAYLCVPS